MILKCLIFSLIFSLAACQVAPIALNGPDGTPHILFSCYSIEDCYKEASQVCQGTYKIVNTSTEVSGSEGSTSSELKLLVKCDKTIVLQPK